MAERYDMTITYIVHVQSVRLVTCVCVCHFRETSNAPLKKGSHLLSRSLRLPQSYLLHVNHARMPPFENASMDARSPPF